jgi:hypothetical protein
MAFTTGQFAALRPYLYHLTSRENAQRLATSAQMLSANELMRRAGVSPEAANAALVRFELDGATVSVMDQRPLREANIAFQGGWDMLRLRAELRARIYFWPGNAEGPIPMGRNHFQRYADEPDLSPVIVRVRLAELLAHNPDLEPEFCRFNSGAPRFSGGRASPRGPDTFQRALQCGYTPGRVREVTFSGAVRLPPSSERATTPAGPWSPLLSSPG